MVFISGPLQPYIVGCRSSTSKLTKAPPVTRLGFSKLSLLRRGYCTVGFYFGRFRLSQPSVDVSDICLESSVIVAADFIFIVIVFLRPRVAVSRMLNEARPVTFSQTAYESTNDCVDPPKH